MLIKIENNICSEVYLSQNGDDNIRFHIVIWPQLIFFFIYLKNAV